MGISQTGEQKFRTALIYGVTAGRDHHLGGRALLLICCLAIQHSRQRSNYNNEQSDTGQSQPRRS
jgi:hypothetical protein